MCEFCKNRYMSTKECIEYAFENHLMNSLELRIKAEIDAVLFDIVNEHNFKEIFEARRRWNNLADRIESRICGECYAGSIEDEYFTYQERMLSGKHSMREEWIAMKSGCEYGRTGHHKGWYNPNRVDRTRCGKQKELAKIRHDRYRNYGKHCTQSNKIENEYDYEEAKPNLHDVGFIFCVSDFI